MLEIFLKKKHFYPNDYKQSIYDIDFSQLKSIGIQSVMIDLDNTLIPYDLNSPTQKIIDLINYIKSLDLNVIIISNNKEKRVKRFCDAIKCAFIFSARKPLKKGFKKALRILGNPSPTSVALIGDQFMTDVFGGNRMGFYTIVVDAIKRKTEKWYTKFNRRLERKVLNRLKRTDLDFYNKLHLDEKR
ncbi:MAG TPA: YqeG family HAD IIIA-type phosphatase [Candidatus Izemoplasmatales bacterium]|nr:YqeG family HAD IIIA-type phosphatase [Candidatus Izemoplasmatales bacterium]